MRRIKRIKYRDVLLYTIAWMKQHEAFFMLLHPMSNRAQKGLKNPV